MSKNSTVLIAKSLQDIFYHLKSVSDLQVLGAGSAGEPIAEKSVTLRHIPELSGIEKKERYLEFGSAVTVAQMLSLGKTNIPPVLYEALESIGNHAIRNHATLGGNICARGPRHTLWSPLMALDARLEFRNSGETKIIPFTQFSEVPPDFILTKIRVPTDEWEVSIFRRVGPTRAITPFSSAFSFLVDTQKDIVANIRIAFTGPVVFHSRYLENKIIGSRLPLSDKFIESLVQEAEQIYDAEFADVEVKPVLKMQFLALLRYSFEQLK